MVSSDDGDRLTPEILARWIAAAEREFVVARSSSDKAIGFCTLSRSEAPLPEGVIEFCHQVLNPWNISLHVSYHLCEAAKSFAHSHRFSSIVTRSLPSNRYALALARIEETREVTGKGPWATSPFRWFAFDMAQYQVGQRFSAYQYGLKGNTEHERIAQNLVC